MDKKRPVVITIAVISLVVLVLVSAGWALAGNLGLVRIGAEFPGISGRVMQFRSADGTIPQDGFDGQPPAGTRPGAGFFNPGGQNSGQPQRGETKNQFYIKKKKSRRG